MNEKDFSEVRECFREAGSKKPDRVIKIDPPVIKSVRTKPPRAQEHTETLNAKASTKKLPPLKDVKNPLGL